MADIDSTLRLWSATASNNKPTGATSIGSNLDDNLRMVQAVVRQYLASPGTTIASAATVDLSTADGHTIPISGTATVTGLGTEVSGLEYLLTTTGAQVWKNSSALVLPGGADFTSAAGDYLFAESKGSGNWVIPFIGRASGQPINAGGSATGLTMVAGVVQVDISGMNSTATAQTTDSAAFFSSATSSVQKITLAALVGSLSASQTQMQSATTNSVLATPGNLSGHPGVAKAWVSCTITGSAVGVASSYNISSVTRTAAGKFTVNFITPFSSANYVMSGSAQLDAAGGDGTEVIVTLSRTATQVAGLCKIATYGTDLAAYDPVRWNAVFFGGQ